MATAILATLTRNAATAERQRVSYTRLFRLDHWSCTSLNSATVVQHKTYAYRHYQLTNRATYVADEAFKHYILSR